MELKMDQCVLITVGDILATSMVPNESNGFSFRTPNKVAEDSELCAAYENWMKWDRNPTTRAQIENMAREGKIEELRKHLLKRLQFGTAGLRARMGAGYNCMNDLVVIQTSQGLANYVANNVEKLPLSVVIGYDGRYQSKRFAELTANAFHKEKFRVWITSRVCATPFIPFAVTYLKCSVGVMVTASHNPKEDNGYKVYWGNGAQIISPMDKYIQASIMEHLEPKESVWDKGSDGKKYTDPLPLIEPVYYELLAKETSYIKSTHETMPLKFTYTAMHGVGFHFVANALKEAEIDIKELCVVREQRDPDPEFSTVKFPNPEEGKSALTLAMKLADKENCPIILANDPDADRLAVAEKLPTGEWKIFNGNELGSLLGWWAWVCYMEKPNRLDPSDCFMIGSTVSSKFLKTMAESEGFNFVETLTGFKWMGNVAYQLLRKEKAVLFAFEEAIGFMFGTHVLDKDGVSAAVYLAQMATILYKQGLTLNQQLLNLYDKYGYHVSHNSYYICHDPVTINKVFANLRNFHGTNGKAGQYPTGLMNNKYKVVAVRDLTTGYDSEEPDQKAKLPVSKSSHMLTFKFDNGMVLTLRTSGTEPKIKYYSELRSAPGNSDHKGTKETLDSLVMTMVNEWLLPEKWGLIARSD